MFPRFLLAGRDEAVAAMIRDHKLSVNLRNSEMKTPLHRAAAGGFVSTIRLLIVSAPVAAVVAIAW